MKLYEISNEYKGALTIMQENGFDEDTINDSLATIKDNFNNKGIAVGKFIKNAEYDIEQIKFVEADLAARKKKISNSIDSIKKYLKMNMEECGISDISCPYFTITLKKNPPKIPETIGVDDVDKKYVKTEIIKKLDKKLLSEDIKNGTVTDINLEQNMRVEIK